MKVSWDYEFPTEWKNIMSQTTNQQTFTRRYPDNLIEISDHNYENHKFVGGKSTISMGIFWWFFPPPKPRNSASKTWKASSRDNSRAALCSLARRASASLKSRAVCGRELGGGSSNLRYTCLKKKIYVGYVYIYIYIFYKFILDIYIYIIYIYIFIYIYITICIFIYITWYMNMGI